MANKFMLHAIDFVMIVLTLLLFVLSAPIVMAEFETNDFEDVEGIAEFCVDIDILGASTCAVDATKEFYQYNLDNIGRELDFQTLKDQGGVCSSWSDYYNQIGEKLGYNTEEVIVKTEEGLYHQFSVWSNQEKYCVIDQTEVFCIGLE